MSDCIDHGYAGDRFGYSPTTQHHFANRYMVKRHQLACDGWEPGLDAHHTCFNKRCINPEHLVAMTRAEHTREHMRLRHVEAHPDHEMEIEYAGKRRNPRCLICRRQRTNVEHKHRRAADPEWRAKRLADHAARYRNDDVYRAKMLANAKKWKAEHARGT